VGTQKSPINITNYLSVTVQQRHFWLVKIVNVKCFYWISYTKMLLN